MDVKNLLKRIEESDCAASYVVRSQLMVCVNVILDRVDGSDYTEAKRVRDVLFNMDRKKEYDETALKVDTIKTVGDTYEKIEGIDISSVCVGCCFNDDGCVMSDELSDVLGDCYGNIIFRESKE